MEELKSLYDKFCSNEYDILDVIGTLPYIEIPNEMLEAVKNAEEQIDYLRFMVTGKEQEERVKKILKELIKKAKKCKK